MGQVDPRLSGCGTSGILLPGEPASIDAAKTAETVMASIIVVSGPNEGDYYPLGTRTMVVGRDEGCPIQITDDRASRKHFQVRFDPATGKYHGLDMKSANGTWINGRKVESDTALEDNDEI